MQAKDKVHQQLDFFVAISDHVTGTFMVLRGLTQFCGDSVAVHGAAGEDPAAGGCKCATPLVMPARCQAAS